jgi:hypothetical protein
MGAIMTAQQELFEREVIATDGLIVPINGGAIHARLDYLPVCGRTLFETYLEAEDRSVPLDRQFPLLEFLDEAVLRLLQREMQTRFYWCSWCRDLLNHETHEKEKLAVTR